MEIKVTKPIECPFRNNKKCKLTNNKLVENDCENDFVLPIICFLQEYSDIRVKYVK